MGKPKEFGEIYSETLDWLFDMKILDAENKKLASFAYKELARHAPAIAEKRSDSSFEQYEPSYKICPVCNASMKGFHLYCWECGKRVL